MFPSTGKRDPISCLECAKNAELDDVVIIGWDKNGNFFLGGSPAKRSEVLMLIETGKRDVMNQIFGV